MTPIHHVLETTRLHVSLNSNARKNEYICLLGENCGTFKNLSNLESHYWMMHRLRDEQWCCDYENCPKSKDPLAGKDKLREHLRDSDHKEDLPRKSKTESEQWWAERKIFPDFWRCWDCLRKVYIKSEGYSCGKCHKDLDRERNKRRKKVLGWTGENDRV